MRTPLEIETEFSERSTLDTKKSFHLVGIGGAGMSGIARMLNHRGFTVKGTDSTPSAVIDSLLSEGITIGIGHSGDLIQKEDALVLTDAIDLKTSPEVKRAKELGCDIYRRSQVLGWLLRDKKTIAVTGTHGKTTTTGMIGAGMRAAGLDPTIVVGAEVPEFGSSIVEGSSEWAVIEACEAYDSLRDFDPHIVVLTNLELDHVDFHGSWEGLKARMHKFLQRIPRSENWKKGDGALVYFAGDQGANELAGEYLEKTGGTALSYEGFDLQSVVGTGVEIPPMALPGVHNRHNADGAICALTCITDNVQSALPGVLAFRGAERRLQVLEDGEFTIIDDYAHHPTEITASLQAIRERWIAERSTAILAEGSSSMVREVQKQKEQDENAVHVPLGVQLSGEINSPRLIVVFQPHLYSRTEPLIKEFGEALSSADLVVLTDIYPAREDPIPGVSSFRIAECVTKPCIYIPQRHLLPRKVAKMARPGDVIVGMGAGNISEFAPNLVKELARLKRIQTEKPQVAVIAGGDSAEREISILSGRAVASALRTKGYNSKLVDVSEKLLTAGNLAEFVGESRPDVCFLALHGTNAEDGAIQGMLELLHIPYTGSGIQANALAMDKNLTKQVLSAAGIPVPLGVLLKTNDTDFESKIAQARKMQTESGVVVKPNQQGSTVGLSFVEHDGDLKTAIDYAFQFGQEVLVEEWLKGTEISVPVLGDRALPAVEIMPNNGSYDFANKYTPGATTEICPARLNQDQTDLAQKYAVQAHSALGCKGCTRTDMIVLDNKIVCLEVNTLPGMTSTSLVPNSALSAGMSFEDLCEWMVTDALKET